MRGRAKGRGSGPAAEGARERDKAPTLLDPFKDRVMLTSWQSILTACPLADGVVVVRDGRRPFHDMDIDTVGVSSHPSTNNPGINQLLRDWWFYMLDSTVRVVIIPLSPSPSPPPSSLS